MGFYPLRVTIHGIPFDTHFVCPIDGESNLRFPVYLNSVNPSGLTQPYGPIGDDRLIHPGGIERPADPPSGSGSFFRPAPSGLERDYRYAATEGFGRDGYRAFSDINWYEAYWSCPNDHYFIYPSGANLPDGALNGNMSDNFNIKPFSNFA